MAELNSSQTPTEEALFISRRAPTKEPQSSTSKVTNQGGSSKFK